MTDELIETQKKRKYLQGNVVKISGDKTIKVAFSFAHKIPKYRKIITKVKNFLVHDEKNAAKIGDRVSFVFTKPFSKRKFSVLTKIGS